MVTRTTRIRTPRKRKDWARAEVTDVLASNSFGVAGDLLSSYKTTIGTLANLSVTVMRMVGFVRLTPAGSATTPVGVQCHWGIAWLPSNITSAGDGDAQIPRVTGSTREAQWLQCGTLLGNEPVAGFLAGETLTPVDTAMQRLDITQMRKQPSRDSELVLIWDTPSTVEAGTVSIELEVQVLLALG